MAYTRSQLPAARAFVDSVYSAGGARVGRGSRHPSTWSDAYTLRVANVWQRQAAAGRPLSLQEARRGPGYTRRVRQEQASALAKGRRLTGGLEHPRQRFVGPRDDRGQPDLDESVGFYARQYRRPEAALRWIEGLSTDRVQVLGWGLLVEGYQFANVERTKRGEQVSAESQYVPAEHYEWRVLFTGARDIAIEQWPAIRDGWHVSAEGEREQPVFEEVVVWEVRWGPGIGD